MATAARPVNTLRLWEAGAPNIVDFSEFSSGDFVAVVYHKITAENLTRVLYPDDSIVSGRTLRFAQEYFLVTCSLADIVAARASGDHTGLPLRRGDPLRHHGHREAILYAQHAEVAEAIDLAQDLATLVRQQQPAQLEARLKRATTRTLEALQRFATGPRRSQGRVAPSTARVRARERCPGEVTSHAAWGDGPYSAVRAKVVHVWEARV